MGGTALQRRRHRVLWKISHDSIRLNILLTHFSLALARHVLREAVLVFRLRDVSVTHPVEAPISPGIVRVLWR